MLREILEALINQEFICEISNPRALDQLKKESVQKYINDSLNPYGRQLTNQDNRLFYASYTDELTKKDRREIKINLENTRDNIEPIIHFLILIMKINESDITLQVGDIIKQSDLLYRIENNSSFEDGLKKVVNQKIFKSIKAGASNGDRLENILSGIERLGYIKLENVDSRIYRVTGKMDYYHKVIDFIIENESILLDEEVSTADQQEMLL